jgi:homoserine acetyltransferase
MASTWGTNTWGSNEWGDDNVTVILSGQSATSSVGSLEAFNEEGWGRQE